MVSMKVVAFESIVVIDTFLALSNHATYMSMGHNLRIEDNFWGIGADKMW